MKKIQKIAACVMLLASLLSHEPNFAIEEPNLSPDEENSFFAKNKECPWYFGLKGWGKLKQQAIENDWGVGIESGIGPFVEWHPLNGMGIQTGLLYSYHYLLPVVQVMLDKERLLGTGLWPIKDNAADMLKSFKWDENVLTSDVHKVTFHAISVPLYLRLYPEKTRQLALYGGPRLVVAWGAEKCKIWHMNTSNLKYKLQQRGLLDKNLLSDLFAHTPGGPSQTVDLNMIWNWDLGFEFNGKNGFILGINGWGLVLGYDCSRLFV
ncbi:hypothetical protein [Candidatus Cardinium hertigii]|uniref:Uncharacterized protein n=1 Tax=Candidatus Cardinium hertigii TaxID=247481 RepID=A0A3N2QCC3_9BACT|nr:hypothetical protein [Candidatus Cardinium hertigii]ROT47329.1 hypothetical protein EDM02_02720 [Candidatus Cardinium hertigii]